MADQKHTKESAEKQYDVAMTYLDSILDEPEVFGSESYAKEVIITENIDQTYSIHYGYVIYGLEESGLRQEALDFENWLNTQGF